VRRKPHRRRARIVQLYSPGGADVPSQKVHIGVAALLSFRLFLVNVADTVPRTSDHIPLLGQYATVVHGSILCDPIQPNPSAD